MKRGDACVVSGHMGENRLGFVYYSKFIYKWLVAGYDTVSKGRHAFVRH